MWIAGIVKADPDTPVAHPAHLRRDRALVKQLEQHLFTLGKITLKHDHRTRRGQIGNSYNVAMAAKVQNRGLQFACVAWLDALVEQPAQAITQSGALRRRWIVQLPFLPAAATA